MHVTYDVIKTAKPVGDGSTLKDHKGKFYRLDRVESIESTRSRLGRVIMTWVTGEMDKYGYMRVCIDHKPLISTLSIIGDLTNEEVMQHANDKDGIGLLLLNFVIHDTRFHRHLDISSIKLSLPNTLPDDVTSYSNLLYLARDHISHMFDKHWYKYK